MPNKKNIFVICVFLVGAFTSLYSYYLFKTYKYIWQKKETKSERDLSDQFIFNAQIPQNSSLLLPKTEDLKQVNSELLKLEDAKLPLNSALKEIEISNAVFVNNKIMKLTYKLQNKTFDTYCYFQKSKKKTDHASFIIPGSGSDVSSKIFENKDVEGMSLDDMLSKVTDTYIFVKPNEDFLAIHNGEKKLNYEFVYYHLLNKGHSYSNLYLQHCLAFIKYLKKKYAETSTFGVSQGGMANLMVSSVAEPTHAWVAAGYSVMFDQLYWGSFNQIVGPSLYAYYQSDSVSKRLNHSKTMFHFSYGKSDNDFYRLEYIKKTTEKKLKSKNTSFIYFNGGHDFPYTTIEQFYVRNSRSF